MIGPLEFGGMCLLTALPIMAVLIGGIAVIYRRGKA